MGLLQHVVGEPLPVVGEPLRFVGDPLRVVGEPLRVVGEPLRVVGDPLASCLENVITWLNEPLSNLFLYKYKYDTI